MSPLDELHARLSELALDQKEAHAKLLLGGNRLAAAQAWVAYKEARDCTNAVATMISQTEEGLSDI